MREYTDTMDSKEIEAGTHIFRVESAPEKKLSKNTGSAFFVWKLSYVVQGESDRKYGEQILLPNMMTDLLRVLGCKEVSPKHFEWDTETVVGDTFQATVALVADKKDPSKMRQQMTEFKDDPTPAGQSDEKTPF